MAWIIEVGPEKAAQIKEAAAHQGLTPEEFVAAAALHEAEAAGEAARPTNGQWDAGDSVGSGGTSSSAPSGSAGVNSRTAVEEPRRVSDPAAPWAEGLRAAADRRDEIGFVAALRQVQRGALTGQDWELTIRLALEAGAHVQARELAQEGAHRCPNDRRLQERARILAPPRVISTFRAGPEAAAAQKPDHEWMRTHWCEHRGQWIALRNGQLLGAAQTLRELRERLQSGGLESNHKPFVTRIC